jgi:hypothetical protein
MYITQYFSAIIAKALFHTTILKLRSKINSVFISEQENKDSRVQMRDWGKKARALLGTSLPPEHLNMQLHHQPTTT